MDKVKKKRKCPCCNSSRTIHSEFGLKCKKCHYVYKKRLDYLEYDN